jgi:hypothetical protein
MSILLTPGFDGRVWYKIDETNLKLTIYGEPKSSDGDLSVSYRFTAPRFDDAKWANARTYDAVGFILKD